MAGKLFVTFISNGFSPFTVYAASETAASIGDKVYPTLQAAVDAVGEQRYHQAAERRRDCYCEPHGEVHSRSFW